MMIHEIEGPYPGGTQTKYWRRPRVQCHLLSSASPSVSAPLPPQCVIPTRGLHEGIHALIVTLGTSGLSPPTLDNFPQMTVAFASDSKTVHDAQGQDVRGWRHKQ